MAYQESVDMLDLWQQKCLFQLGRVEVEFVCLCVVKIFWAYFTVTQKLRSCHKNWWGVKCIEAHTVTKAAQPIQQGARLVLLGREGAL